MGCEPISFSSPQPNDSKNIEKFPRKMRGNWASKTDSVFISKRYFKQIPYYIETYSKTIFDTNPDIKIVGNKFYDLKEDSTEGMRFVWKGDSISIYSQGDITEYLLDDSTFLRQIVKGKYTFNSHKKSGNWTVYFVEINEDKSIVCRASNGSEEDILISILDNKNVRLPLEITDSNKVDSTIVWDVSLSSPELLRFIELGGFSDTVMMLYKQDKY